LASLYVQVQKAIDGNYSPLNAVVISVFIAGNIKLDAQCPTFSVLSTLMKALKGGMRSGKGEGAGGCVIIAEITGGEF
jgi:hypothetical protein